VAIESTGVYWKPVFNILEGLMAGILVHARHVQAVPGHKTDARDSAWLADLLRHGLLKARFIPPRPLRDLRELPRYRQSVLRDQSAVANRMQKGIESGNIKRGQVASDALGVSGRAMLRALAAGATAATTMAAVARKTLQRQKPA
jgi:transposase